MPIDVKQCMQQSASSLPYTTPILPLYYTTSILPLPYTTPILPLPYTILTLPTLPPSLHTAYTLHPLIRIDYRRPTGLSLVRLVLSTLPLSLSVPPLSPTPMPITVTVTVVMAASAS